MVRMIYPTQQIHSEKKTFLPSCSDLLIAWYVDKMGILPLLQHLALTETVNKRGMSTGCWQSINYRIFEKVHSLHFCWTACFLLPPREIISMSCLKASPLLCTCRKPPLQNSLWHKETRQGHALVYSPPLLCWSPQAKFFPWLLKITKAEFQQIRRKNSVDQGQILPTVAPRQLSWLRVCMA